MKKFISTIAAITICMSFSVVSFPQEKNSLQNEDGIVLTNLDPVPDKIGERE